MWKFHKWFERHTLILLIGILVVVSIGGLVQITPLFFIESTIERVDGVRPYTPLELAGREIYVREGCYVCHSQMIRPFRSETERYGEYSKAGEFVYDHPFQWGSKRTGPDLAREGTGNLKKSDGWHFRHLREPSSMSEGSIMPAYPFLMEQDIDTVETAAKIRAMQKLGVPYEKGFDQVANQDLMTQARGISDNLKSDSIRIAPSREVIAVIAYLQRLGTDISKNKN